MRNRQQATVLVATIVAAVGIVTPADAAITYMTQARSVRANGFVDADFEGAPTFNALDFGVFNRTSSWTFSGGRGTAQASQLSRLLPKRIEVMEFAEVNARLPGLEGLAQSLLEITFRLTEASSFIVTQTHAFHPGLDAVLASLTGPNGVVFGWTSFPNTWPPGSLSGILPAGDYTFSSRCRIQTVQNIGLLQASTSLVLTIPAPANIAAMHGVCWLIARRKRSAGASG